MLPRHVFTGRSGREFVEIFFQSLSVKDPLEEIMFSIDPTMRVYRDHWNAGDLEVDSLAEAFTMSPTAILPKPLKTVQDVLNYRDYNGLGIGTNFFVGRSSL